MEWMRTLSWIVRGAPRGGLRVADAPTPWLTWENRGGTA